MNEIITAIVILTGLGLLFATIIAVAYKKLRVYEDPRIDKVEELLPASNCGGCGEPGCRAFAEKVVAGTIAFITAGSTVQEEEQMNLKLEEEEQTTLKTEEEEETDEEEEQEDLRKQTKIEEHKHTTNATLSGAITGGLVVLGAQGIYHKVRKMCGSKRRVTVTMTTRDVSIQSPCTYDMQRNKFKYLGTAHANEYCVLTQQPKETTKQVEGL